MKSKTSSFNKTLFFGLWKRFWPLFAAYFAIWILLMPVSLGSELASVLSHTGETIAESAPAAELTQTSSLAANFGSKVFAIASSIGTVMSLIFCVLVAMAAYSYLYNPRAVSAMGSLPMKREHIFRTQMFSGITLLLLINLAVCLITLATGAHYGAKAGFDAAYVFQWLGIVCLQELFFYGFATMCASFTGNIVVLPLVYFVLNFAVWAFASMIRAVMSYFIYGYSSRGIGLAEQFSPPIELAKSSTEEITRKLSETSTLITGYTYQNWTKLLIYALVGVAFASFAVQILKRRRMETAGDVVALRPLKPAFKYCMTAGGALVLGLLLFSITNTNGMPVYSDMGNVLLMLFYMLLGAFVGYFASEMLMQKTLRVFGDKWAGFGVSCAVIAVLLLCLRFDAFGIERHVPDAGEVQGVSLSTSGSASLLEEPENIAAACRLQQNIIAHKTANIAAAKQSEQQYMVNFLYTLKDGRTFDRQYILYTDKKGGDITDLTDLLNTREAVLARKSMHIPVNISTILDPSISYFDAESAQYKSIALSTDEMYDLYANCIVPDTNELKLGKIWLITDESYDTRVLDCQISFKVQKLAANSARKLYDSEGFDTTLTLDAKRSYDWVQSHYHLSLVTMGESKKITEEAEAKGTPVSQTDIKTTESGMNVPAA